MITHTRKIPMLVTLPSTSLNSNYLQLKKFQSKNKGKQQPDSVPDTQTHDNAEEPTTDIDQAVQEEAVPSSSSSSVVAGPAGQPFIPATEPVAPVDLDQLNHKLERLGLLNSTEMLESQIHELTRKLNEERQSNQSLETRLREQYSNVDQLKLQLQQSVVGNVSNLQSELAPLRDQLDNQIRTVALLVGEKAEISAQLANSESLAKSKTLENEELHAKLGASRHQVQKLKEELATLRKSHERFDSSQQNLCTEVETTRDELKALRKANEDAREEILELRRKFELKEIDFNALDTSHRDKCQEIEALHLRLTQLGDDCEDSLLRDRAMEANAQQRFAMEAQIEQLLVQVEKANTDRDTAASHYQNYVQQLNREREGWIVKVQEVTKERDALSQRDQQLVHHIGELEKQMQQQRSVQEKVSSAEEQSTPTADPGKERELQEKVTEVTNQMEVLEGKLTEERENVRKMSELFKSREEQIECLERELERLRIGHVDPHQLNATLESEKVAASRAMTQNQQLRAQLEEMQTAFVQMTNDKANLMTELESERYLGREMRSKYEELESLRQKLHFKDEEMIRLAHESTEQAKSILVLQQELDQMRHLEVNTRNQSHLQAEIVKQREQISKLQAMIRKKAEEAKEMHNGEGAVVENGDQAGDIVNPMEVSVAEEVDEGLRTEVALTSAEGEGGPEADELIIPENVEVQELPTGEAMVKLQARFTRTMDEIAELTEEKHRLEHLVIQLQGETETIGEYIALYQGQRKLLRQREIEKDIQVQKITADREEMKEKLQKLNALVEQMLSQRNISVQSGSVVNGDQFMQSNDGVPELAPGGGTVTATDATAPSASSRETAEQILDLLTEIKTQNTNFLTDPMPTTCSCCSGQLITV